jgi:hypothetical protein
VLDGQVRRFEQPLRATYARVREPRAGIAPSCSRKRRLSVLALHVSGEPHLERPPFRASQLGGSTSAPLVSVSAGGICDAALKAGAVAVFAKGCEPGCAGRCDPGDA